MSQDNYIILLNTRFIWWKKLVSISLTEWVTQVRQNSNFGSVWMKLHFKSAFSLVFCSKFRLLDPTLTQWTRFLRVPQKLHFLELTVKLEILCLRPYANIRVQSGILWDSREKFWINMRSLGICLCSASYWWFDLV